MESLQRLGGDTLRWRQPHIGQHMYELHARGGIAAMLQQRGAGAVAESAEGGMAFEHAGFWRRRILVRSGDAGGTTPPVAVFEARGTGGVLTMEGTRRYHWHANGALQTRAEWTDAAGGSLVHFTSTPGLVRIEGNVQILPDGMAAADLPVLVILGWHLLVALARDVAEAAGGVAAVTATVS